MPVASQIMEAITFPDDGNTLAFLEQEKSSASTAWIAVCFLILAFFTLGYHQARGWRLTLPEGRENLAAFSAREVKIRTAEEREKEELYSAEGQ